MNRILVLALALAFCGASTFAAPAKGSRMPEVLSSYLKIHESLADDSLNQVQAEAAKIADAATDAEMKLSAQALSKDTVLDGARKDFKLLSKAMDKWAKKAKPSGIDRMFCSMAHGPWLQKSGTPVRNPYYGKEMLECGTKE